MTFKMERTIVNNRPAFIRVKGRLVRDTSGREVTLRSHTKGDSLAKFPRTLGQIGYHKWS